MPSCDARFLALVNEAQQRLVMRDAAWYDFHYRYQISVTNGNITWPREIAAITAISQCCYPIPMRNMWFEFLESGYGLRNCDGQSCECLPEMLDRGVSPLSTDMSGSYKLKLYCDLSSDNGSVVIVRGYDADGNWIRTVDGSNYIDGEKISTSTTGTLSNKTYSSVKEIIKPETDGPVRLYEYDSTDSSQSLIGTYQWNETVPMYRRSYVGGICDPTVTTAINVVAKREFIPVADDNDILMVGNLPALKAMCLAILQEDKNDLPSAMVNEQRAYRIMDDEAKHYLGPGMKVPIRVEGETWGAGGAGDPYMGNWRY
jgi:hypothetical protein